MLDALKPSTVEQSVFDQVVTMEPTPRVDRMRNAFFDIKPSISIERARIEARVMKETEGEPMITRRAKVFAAVAREMSIDIYPDELFVGCSSDKRRCHNISPGAYAAEQDARNRRSGFGKHAAPRGLSDEDGRELVEELAPYWKEQGRTGRVASWHYGHNIHAYEKVLKKGFLGIKQEAEERLSRLDVTEPEDLKKVPFLEGVVMVMEAAADAGKRYADRARELAADSEDSQRKAELLKIAAVCDRVPANPARTFYEALQSYHFAYLFMFWEMAPHAGYSLGRMDQYLYPYYESDITQGAMTREDAQELIDAYLVKLNEAPGPAAMGVGGIKANGQDATNELSYMFIEGTMHTRLVYPWIAVLVHSKSPDDFLVRAAELTSLGTGHPQYLNADVMVAQALARGAMGGPMVTLEDARAVANIGCLELGFPGKDSGYLYVGGHNLALALELALNNGVRRSDGQRIGVETGDPREFTSFEMIQEAFLKQVAFMRRNTQISGNAFEQQIIDLCPTVYESALIEDCIEEGLCREEGGAHYNHNTGGTETGSSDAGDSLAALKKLVFDDEKITMAQLCDALDANFEGHEDIRKMCLDIPKFGNDDDSADQQKAWVVHQWVTEFMKIKNLRGGYGCPGGSSMAAYVPEGKIVGALPSGRRAGEPLAPAGSPSTGKDVNGVTSVLKSMGKVDGVEILAGLSLTTRIDPAVFKSRDGVKRVADMIRTFVDQKIFHLQLNVTSTDALKAAQEKPEDYRDLMVKVAGYNAYFTRLHKELQDTIIARTAHGL